MVHHARAVLQQVERLRGELGDYARGLKAHLRLLANTVAVHEFLPTALAPFLVTNPQLDIELEERPSYRIVAAIAEGVAELGIVSDAVERGSLEAFPFRHDRLVVVAPKRHPLARRREIRLAEIVHEDFIGLAEGSALQDYLGDYARREGGPLRLRVRLASFDAICAVVAAGAGMAIVPVSAAERARASVAIARLREPWAERRLLLVARRAAELAGPARRLLELLSASPAPRARRKTTARSAA